MNTEVMFSSKSAEWETPQDLFDKLNEEFHFTLDVCATPENTKCEHYYTSEQDGLSQPWKGVIWCNPPYGKSIGSWVRRGLLAAADGNVVVMLLPARTDTRWFHEYIYNKAETRFIKGRLKFGGNKNAAPFPSMIVVFRFAPGQMETQNIREEKHEGVPEQARDRGGAMEKQMF